MFLCVRYRKRLGTYLDGKLSRRKQTAIERHLKKCYSCRLVLNNLRDLEQTLHTLDVPPAPASLTSRILAEAYKQKRSIGAGQTWSWRRVLMPYTWSFNRATAASLLIGLIMGAYMGWTSYWSDQAKKSLTEVTVSETLDESLYIAEVLSAAPQGSFEAATLAMLEEKR